MEYNSKNSFSYTYSAREQSEVEKIRNKYIASEDKTEKLRRLDKSVTSPGQVAGLCLGVIGVLIFGTGMCFCLDALTVSWMNSTVLGIALCVIGIPPMIFAYPACRIITEKRRKAIAPEIIKLANDILNEQ